jgi:hypothetical protein
MRLSACLVSVSLLSAFTACATTESTSDELAGESSTDDAVTDGKADAAVDGTYTYYAIHTDLRRCSAPACGGWFLSRVNRSTTDCVDGSTKASCQIHVLDWSESGLVADLQTKLTDAAQAAAVSGNSTALVRGRFSKTHSNPRFVITEAWLAESSAPTDGVFARVKDAGIRCITTPCASLIEKGLNESRTANIAGLDYSPAGLTEREIEGFNTSLFDPAGIIVVGDRYTIHENGHTAKGRTANNAFHQIVNPPAACVVTGCSRELCADESRVSTCIYKPEYACYATATCERQDDGACGWTETHELAACIADAQN